MSKSLIFSIDFEGGRKTVDELAKVEVELAGITKEILAAKKAGESEVYKKLRLDQEQLRKESAELRKELKQQINEFNKIDYPKDSVIGMEQAYAKLRLEVRGMSKEVRESTYGQDIIKQADDIKTEILKVDGAIKDFHSNIGNYKSALLDIADLLTGGLLTGGIITLINGFINLGSTIKDTGAEFESTTAAFENVFGDTKVAQDYIKIIQDFAANTPYEFDKLSASILKTVNRGFVPMEDEMTKLGDLASSQKKDFDQLIEAMLDAQTGEFERLKEFGIRASKENGLVTLSFKGQTVVVKDNEKAIRDAILAFGEMEGVVGSMEKQSTTFSGMMSNLNDLLSQLYISIFNFVLPALKGMITSFIVIVNWMRALPALISENRDLLYALGVALVTWNAQAVLATANSIRLAVAEKGRAIVTGAVTAAQNLLNAAMTANPIGLVIKAVGLLVAGFIVLYNRSETVRAGIAGLGEVAKTVFTIIKEAVGSFVSGWNKLKDGDIKGGLLDFSKGLVKSNPLGIAFTEGKRLGAAFNKGYNDQLKEEANTKKNGKKTTAGTTNFNLPGGGGGGGGGSVQQDLKDYAQTGSIEYLEKAYSSLQDKISKTNVKSPLLEGLVIKSNQAKKALDDAKLAYEILEGRNSDSVKNRNNDYTVDPIAGRINVRQVDDTASKEKALKREEELLQKHNQKMLELADKNIQEGDKRRNKEYTQEQLIWAKLKAGVELNEKEKQAIRKQFSSAAFDLAQSVSSAIFSLQAQERENELNDALTAIDKEYEHKLEMAQGNAQLEESLKKELEAKKLEVQKQAFEKDKEAKIAQAIISAALAIIQAFAQLGPIAGAISAVGVGIATGFQIASIKKTKFAAGGFTGDSSLPPDETGEKPVGIATYHVGEYTSPRKQVNKFPALFDWLNKDRLRSIRGFATGGFSTSMPRFMLPTFERGGNNGGNFTDAQMTMLQNVIKIAVEEGSYKGSYRGAADGTFEGNNNDLQFKQRRNSLTINNQF